MALKPVYFTIITAKKTAIHFLFIMFQEPVLLVLVLINDIWHSFHNKSSTLLQEQSGQWVKLFLLLRPDIYIPIDPSNGLRLKTFLEVSFVASYVPLLKSMVYI